MPPTPNPLKTGGKLFAAWFVFCAVIGLGLIGLLAWAVITLVNHFT